MSRHAEHPGLCDARAAIAFHAAPPARWIDPARVLRSRLAVLLAAFAAGVVVGAILI